MLNETHASNIYFYMPYQAMCLSLTKVGVNTVYVLFEPPLVMIGTGVTALTLLGQSQPCLYSHLFLFPFLDGLLLNH